ncbi:MAG: hypothetical protein ACREIB_05830, partial [Pseudomonadota bacterium]
DALRASCEGMQDDGQRGKGAGASRRHRAIQRALELEWLSVNGVGQRRLYSPGPVAPPAEVADLEGLVS